VNGDIFPNELAHTHTRVRVPQCQGNVDLIFTVPPPEEFQRLQELSNERDKQQRDDSIIGFQGIGEGWVVEDAAGEPSLLLYSLDKVQQDSAETELWARRTHQLLRR
jgi:hypothetical protein